MNIEFVRFKAHDELELQGWLTQTEGDMAVIHVHGMSGNGYENYFLDTLRKLYTKHSLSFFPFDNRGRGIISRFRHRETTKLAGSCFEVFAESIHDIQGAIDYLKSSGKKKFILQGHSLGASKVVNYILKNDNTDVKAAILLAPTDMSSWAGTDPNNPKYLKRAKELMSLGQPEQLVGAQCWDDKTPLSAQTYPTICEAGTDVDIYGPREGGALLGKVSIPMLIVYGDKDIGITYVDTSIDSWLTRVNAIKHSNTQISIIQGAEHSFQGYEKQLATSIQSFLTHEIS